MIPINKIKPQFRFVYDCETMEKVLQWRYVDYHYTASGTQTSTPWETIPTVLGTIKNGEVEAVYGDKK